jgi:zinc transport system substrate-binding protein
MMQKSFVFFFILCVFVFFAGCMTVPDAVEESSSDLIHDSLIVAATIMPLQAFVDYIGSDTVQTQVLLPPGSDPHTYELTPRERIRAEKANVIVMIGVGMPFEKSIVSQIKGTNPDIIIINVSDAVSLLQEEDGHGIDPHIWLSPTTAQQIVNMIAEELSHVRPAYAVQYHERATAFIQELQVLDNEFSDLLSRTNTTTFLISHPSWGYTAERYGLTQISIYEHGKEPSPKTIQGLIDTAKAQSISVIIADPLENQNAARVIANAISGKVVVINPLAYEFVDNMRRFLYAISRNEA